MIDHGIKVGDNIETVADKDAKLTTKYPTLKFFKWGDAQFTTDGSKEGSVEIDHDLGYAPISIAYRKHTAQNTFLTGATTYPNAFSHLGAVNQYAGGNVNVSFVVRTTTSKLIIENNAVANNLAPNTTYYFRYYILVDLSQAFSGAFGGGLSSNYGFKVSKPGIDVTIAKEYELVYSSKYKSVQYFNEYIQEQDLTLPLMSANEYDPYEEEATYVDFEHDFGYPPFYLAYFTSPTGSFIPLPFYLENSIDIIFYNVAGFSDANRVRLFFWRAAALNSPVGPTWNSWPEETITLRCILFSENLMGESS